MSRPLGVRSITENRLSLMSINRHLQSSAARQVLLTICDIRLGEAQDIQLLQGFFASPVPR
jgi:hypothetical protein